MWGSLIQCKANQFTTAWEQASSEVCEMQKSVVIGLFMSFLIRKKQTFVLAGENKTDSKQFKWYK